MVRHLATSSAGLAALSSTSSVGTVRKRQANFPVSTDGTYSSIVT